jgi:hypothetical protein
LHRAPAAFRQGRASGALGRADRDRETKRESRLPVCADAAPRGRPTPVADAGQHWKTSALFEAASSPGFQDPQLQAFAAKTLPVLHEHHPMVEKTQPSSQASR